MSTGRQCLGWIVTVDRAFADRVNLAFQIGEAKNGRGRRVGIQRNARARPRARLDPSGTSTMPSSSVPT